MTKVAHDHHDGGAHACPWSCTTIAKNRVTITKVPGNLTNICEGRATGAPTHSEMSPHKHHGISRRCTLRSPGMIAKARGIHAFDVQWHCHVVQEGGPTLGAEMPMVARHPRAHFVAGSLNGGPVQSGPRGAPRCRGPGRARRCRAARRPSARSMRRRPGCCSRSRGWWSGCNPC